MSDLKIISARIQSSTRIVVKLSQPLPNLKLSDFSIEPRVGVKNLQTSETAELILTTAPLNVQQNYRLKIKGIGSKALLHDGILDQFYSDKALGCHRQGNQFAFRIFAPRALQVKLVIFNRHDTTLGQERYMQRDRDGVWEFLTKEDLTGKYYGYRVTGPTGEGEIFDDNKIIADPYSRAVATLNHYHHPARTLIPAEDKFNWEGDTFLKIPMEDLIIYEMHVRDLTAHPSSGVSPELRGTYRGLIQSGSPGGIDHIKSLGVNAVEFLPIHDFANLEPSPEENRTSGNVYGRNHWGYMTSCFFAPESYYATGGDMEPGKWNGVDGRQVREFKEVVKAFHQAGIAVLLDVVYNHVSQYDQNPFKLIDKKYYFRLDDDQNFLSQSGCGNDFKTERAMARRMILDSIEYWMREYHIDGFRFDLAAMIDWETCDAILQRARTINPNAIIIAEAWGGGGYTPAEHSQHGWAAWNDQIRNGVKGWQPTGKGDQGFIFGKWKSGTTMASLRSYVSGTLKADGGLFQHKSHSINYLESHDDHTLGDFIRIASGEVQEDQIITDIDAHARLSPRQLQMNKLAALFLFTCQGAVMIHEGQEFARSKVIAKTAVPDPQAGQIDHNSYNKDNETNWINFQHAERNRELVDYYRGMIALRKTHRAFRWSDKKDIEFLPGEGEFALGYLIRRTSSGDTHDFVVLMNGHGSDSAVFKVPTGEWELVVNEHKAGTISLGKFLGGDFVVMPTSGVVMRMR
ncbi:MAG: alpha-amylase family glycosyl hydrolase [candidate division KSB1 bacterium]|nr:alpha-amylase family glycosyl hydrolase [candidate division KSB1 bacterium]MDZ7310961.1 alpha-amylase family glycosyl hydrolase [candidate division KSB1 bacterium]